jgi:hypothetical protein
MLTPRDSRPRRKRSALLITASLLACILGGCSSGSTTGGSRTEASTPSYVTEPPTHQQSLVNKGAQLVVADGCSACHLNATSKLAPSFASFAGDYVTLVNGRHTLVDERFLREAMLDPRATLIRGYDPTPMLAALRRLHLGEHPGQVTALAAFIEQIGPEPE